jgi:hypothetical protein
MNTVKRFRMTERVRQPVYTKDAILSPPSREELAENQRRTAKMSGLDLGKLWIGDLKPKLDAIKGDRAKLADALSSLIVGLGEYGNRIAQGDDPDCKSSSASGSMRLGGAGSLASIGDSGGAQLRKWRDQTSNQVNSINAKNREFWDRKPAT